jgi:PHD/YefM family antitoxin component YafN of YafNO toxin-antitoxin module
MVATHPQYVVNEKQQRVAGLLPVSEWERLMDELEELEDIRAYDAAKAKSQRSVPFEQAVREIEARRGA